MKRYKSLGYLLLCLLLISISPYAAIDSADQIFINGKIITVDAAFSIHSSMALKGDRIIAVGTARETSVYKTQDTKIIDLKGKMRHAGDY